MHSTSVNPTAQSWVEVTPIMIRLNKNEALPTSLLTDRVAIERWYSR